MVRFCRSALIVVFAACFAAPVAPTHAQTGPDGGVLLTEDEAYRRDAEAYVQAYGGTIEAAVQHLKLQSPIAELGEKLEVEMPDTFAGLWIEHKPKLQVVVQLTKGDKKAVQAYLQNGALSDIVTVKNAPISHKKLHTTLRDFAQTLKDLGVPAEGAINVQKNRGEVYVTNREQLDAALAKAGKQLPTNVEVITIDKLSQPAANWYGGISLSACTAGFTVQLYASGTRYSSTAGHCDNSQASPMSTPILSLTGGAYDFSIRNPPSGSTLKNWVADNINDSTPYYRSITSSISRPAVGTVVCKYGKTTGYTCGTVEANRYLMGGVAAWLLITGSNTNANIACGGDSGGPVYYGSTAAGLVQGSWCNDPNTDLRRKFVAMPIQSLMDFNYYPSTN